jgi:hypothetical protein
MDFKFFQKPIPIQPPGNMYLMFNMDDALINVIRWLQYHNIEMLSDFGTELSMVNVPINNCRLRITGWRNWDLNSLSPTVEINYSVIEINTRAMNFVFRMEEQEFQRRIDITGL